MHVEEDRNTNSFCCKKRLKRGLLFNTQKWTVQGDPCADKTRNFNRKGHLGGKQQGKWIQENCHAACSLQFYGDVVSFPVVSGQSFWPRAFLVVCASLSQDGFQAGAFWEGRIMGWSLFSFWSFPDSVVVACSAFLSRTFCVRLTHANRYYWEVLVSASPNNFILENKHLKTRYPQRIILGTVELKIY